MSKFEDFENAPVGATATNADGIRAMKMSDGGWVLVAPACFYYAVEEMVQRGFTLDASAPATAREALDLAWELAHPVKEGQVIPKGARYLKTNASGLAEFIAQFDFKILPGVVPFTRTLEPLPEPEPEWLDAPAVIAVVNGWMSGASPQVFTRYDYEAAPSEWLYNGSEKPFRWQDLRDVTPLYPKGQEV